MTQYIDMISTTYMHRYAGDVSMVKTDAAKKGAKNTTNARQYTVMNFVILKQHPTFGAAAFASRAIASSKPFALDMLT